MSNRLIGRKVIVKKDNEELRAVVDEQGVITDVCQRSHQYPITIVFADGLEISVAPDEVQYMNNRPVVLP